MSQAFVELYPESRTRLQPLPTGADLGAGLAAAVPFICAARGAFLAERLKKRLSLRKILAIEGRQCDLDGFGNVLPSNRCKKTLSSRIIPVIEGRRRLPERINRCRVERLDRDRATNFVVSADFPVLRRLNRRLAGLSDYRLRLAFIPGARSAPTRPRRDQSPLPSWLIFAVATSSIMARSLSGTGIGVQALSPSMKKMRPPELPSTLASAALSP